MSYLNSVSIIGFVGADPEQRQGRNNNGSKFTVLSVATQRSWKNTDDEWASKTEWHRVCVFRPRLAEYVATTIKKGSHVLCRGQPRQHDLRTRRRQRQESQDQQADVLVHSRRCPGNLTAVNPSRKQMQVWGAAAAATFLNASVVRPFNARLRGRKTGSELPYSKSALEKD